MPDPMPEKLVPRTIARIRDHFACSSIHLFRHQPGTRRLQRRGLSLMHDVKNAAHLIRRFAEHKRAADVRLIPLDRAAAIDQQNCAFFHYLWLQRSMWQCGFRTHLHACAALRSEEHTSELQSRQYLVCRLLLEKKK